MAGKTDFYEKLMKKWWGKVGIGLFILAISAQMYHDFSELESGDAESLRVNFILKVLYDVGGKWAVVAIFFIIGAGVLGYGLSQLLLGSQESVQTPDENDVENSGFLYVLRSTLQKFWNPIYTVLGLLNIAALILLLRWIWPDAYTPMYGIPALVGAGLAYLEMETLCRMAGASDGPLVDWSNRLTQVFVAGQIVAIVVCVFLTLLEHHWIAERMAKEQEYRALMNNPNAQRGFAAMREYQDAKRAKSR